MVKITDKTDYSRFVRPWDEDEGIWLDHLEIHLVTHPAGQVKEVHVHDPPQDHVITMRSGANARWTVKGQAYRLRARRRDRHPGRRGAPLQGARRRGRRVISSTHVSAQAGVGGRDRRPRRLPRPRVSRSRTALPPRARGVQAAAGADRAARSARARPADVQPGPGGSDRSAEHSSSPAPRPRRDDRSGPLYQGTIWGAFKNALDWLHMMGGRDPPYLHGQGDRPAEQRPGARSRLQAMNAIEFSVRALAGGPSDLRRADLWWGLRFRGRASGRRRRSPVRPARPGGRARRRPVSPRTARSNREEECNRTAELVAAA